MDFSQSMWIAILFGFGIESLLQKQSIRTEKPRSRTTEFILTLMAVFSIAGSIWLAAKWLS